MEIGEDLIKWFTSKKKKLTSALPGEGAVDYASRLATLHNYLNTTIHPEVVAGAMIHDGGYLNDHGPEHIRTVMQRLSKLLSAESCELTGYELYLLIVATHFHDVGNIDGREGHELKIPDFMREMGKLLGDEGVEHRWINNIAQAHGGRGGDRILELSTKEHVNHKVIRPRLLAGLLRFADELSDDAGRASRYLLSKNLIPEGSQIFHEYAAALHSVVIEMASEEITLTFDIPKDKATIKFGKKKKDGTIEHIYLVDEILSRTLKMRSEACICIRAMRPCVFIDTINVNIVISSNNRFEELEKIGYRLDTTAVPASGNDDVIFQLCPEISDWHGLGNLSGETLLRHLEAHHGQ